MKRNNELSKHIVNRYKLREDNLKTSVESPSKMQ